MERVFFNGGTGEVTDFGSTQVIEEEEGGKGRLRYPKK